MLHEHDIVALVHDIPAETGTRWPGTPSGPLHSGLIGAVVAAYGDESNHEYEVEFVAADGSTLALLTLGDADIKLAE
ncbi:DUF4926 domain-containing protein [Antrihabitans cavernicola]|uniref:DUF4926 domain-containing protein n=1 Tax=Antrihabitans cavernicola TaxID=2495913 RepID=A0A5A7SEF9_9NOCA|nr:DUF4926 domain-containing protein [Spelaeibacter cavernicola]KAA0024540.1 DUF4926 domain-containing protein [Spelaeibacter cavernicola]